MAPGSGNASNQKLLPLRGGTYPYQSSLLCLMHRREEELKDAPGVGGAVEAALPRLNFHAVMNSVMPCAVE
jgi:hypothetical protein